MPVLKVAKGGRGLNPKTETFDAPLFKPMSTVPVCPCSTIITTPEGIDAKSTSLTCGLTPIDFESNSTLAPVDVISPESNVIFAPLFGIEPSPTIKDLICVDVAVGSFCMYCADNPAIMAVDGLVPYAVP